MNLKREAAWANRQGKDTPMIGKPSEQAEAKEVYYGLIEAYARERLRE
ncbi:MAG: hypothetical protein HYU33_04975 [Candidatus Omnitrophica bacterium]|nr:hypothetical protein [Candidatus Omnitrophota bacterium]